MNRDFVTRLFSMSHDQTVKLVEPVECADCAELANGKNAAWLLGHLVVGADFAAQLTGRDRLFEAHDAIFSPGTEPVADRGAYPTKSELLEQLGAAHKNAIEGFLAADDAALGAEFPMEDYRSFFPRVGDGVVYLLTHHEPYHNGQLQQWLHTTGRTPASVTG